MQCSLVNLRQFGGEVGEIIRENPKKSLAFVLGTILLLTGIIGHFYGMNTVAVGLTISASGLFFGAVGLSFFCALRQHDAEREREQELKPFTGLLQDSDWVIMNEEAHTLTEEEIKKQCSDEDDWFDIEEGAHALTEEELANPHLYEGFFTPSSPINKLVLEQNWMDFSHKVAYFKEKEDFQAVEENCFGYHTLHFLAFYEKGVSGFLFFCAKAVEKDKGLTSLLNAQAHEDAKKYTPLHIAVVKNNVQMVKWILKLNPDLSIEDSDGLTPKQLAEKLGHRECTALFPAT